MNAVRKGIKDIWNARLVENAVFGLSDIPQSPSVMNELPKKVIKWSDAPTSQDYDAWVCFYEDTSLYDGKDGIWQKPDRALKILKRFKGVILPDYEKDPNLPEPEKLYNVYRKHALGYWFAKNGLQVINSVHYDKDTGISDILALGNIGVVAISTAGLDPMDKNSMTSLSVSLHMVRMMCAPFCIFVYGPVLSPVSRMMRVGESVYVIDEVSGSVGVCTKPSTGKETAPIDRNAPFISGIGAAGIKLGTRYEDIAEILEADDVVYDDDMAWYRYTVPGVIDFSFARCNDRIFSIGLYPGYKGKVLGYENIWECTEKEFFSDGYGNYEYLDEDECYESREDRVDISFDDETGKTDWVAVRQECALGNSSEMDLSDWT